MLAAALFALAVLVVLWGVSSASERTDAIRLVSPVAAGEAIEASDLAPTPVAVEGGFGRIYTYDQAPGVVGAIAVVDLAPGDLLGPTMITGTPETRPGERLVGTLLRAGRFPSGIHQGDTGEAVFIESDQAAQPLTAPIRVVSVDISETGELLASLAVPIERAPTVASWSGSSNLVLIINPIGAEP